MSRVKCFVVFNHIGNAEKNYFFRFLQEGKKEYTLYKCISGHFLISKQSFSI
jgi:hypothetical protein